MNQWTLFAFSGVIVAVTSAYGLFTARELIRRIIAANLAGSGVFVINAPWTLHATLKESLPYLVTALAQYAGASYLLEQRAG